MNFINEFMKKRYFKSVRLGDSMFLLIFNLYEAYNVEKGWYR